jgi:hypothetical protein
MQIQVSQPNRIDILVEPRETLHFAYEYLQTPDFDMHVTPSREAFVPRLLAGKLWEGHCAATSEPVRVRLGGDAPTGTFSTIRVDPGKTFLVRLRHVAAYHFEQGGGFVSATRLWDPVRWMTGLTFALLARGPAVLVFYGAGVENHEAAAGEHCFADQLIGFEGASRFRIGALKPIGAGGDVINALSQTIDVEFCDQTQLVRSTVRTTAGGNWAKRVAYLLFTVGLGGWVFEKCVLEDWIWSWMR